MTNYEMLLKINDKAKENIEKLYNSGKMDLMNKCLKAIITLRQFLEHMLFAIALSINDYKYMYIPKMSMMKEVWSY